MKPILFTLFGIPFASYYIFFALAGLTALALALFLAWRRDDERVLDAIPGLFAVCYVCGWFGARILSILNEQPEVRTFSDFLAQMFSVGPMTFYGGAVLAVFGGLLYLRKKSLDWPIFLDIAVPAGVAALGVGRIGCFLNGCDFGIPWRVTPSPQIPWWVFENPVLNDGIPRVPAQLEEMLFSFLLAGLAILIFEKTLSKGRGRQGFLGPGVAAVSALHRFFNEWIRGDERGSFLGSIFSLSQGFALIIFFLCCIIMWLNARHFSTRRSI